MTLHDIIDYCFELRKRGNLLDDSLVINIIVSLQKFIDFQELISVLIKRRATDLILHVLGQKKLKVDIAHKAEVASLKRSLIDDELGFTSVLWNLFEVTYTDIDFMDTVLNAIVSAFVKSPKFLEVKIYLLM